MGESRHDPSRCSNKRFPCCTWLIAGLPPSKYQVRIQVREQFPAPHCSYGGMSGSAQLQGNELPSLHVVREANPC